MELKLLYVGVGGFFGAVLRYWISGWVYQLTGTDFPYGTLVVNLIGAFLLGIFMAVALQANISTAMRHLVAIGMLGAFTTFSTFSYETLQLLQHGELWRGLLNIGVSIIAGLIAVWLGMLMGRFMV